MPRAFAALCALAFLAGISMADDRVKFPPASERDKATKLVHDLFKEEFATNDAGAKASFAMKLFQQALENADDPAAQFVLYKESAEAAVALNTELALRACDAITRRFEGPAAVMLEPIIDQVAAKATERKASEEVATFLLNLVEQTLVADDIEVAGRLHKLVESCAARAKSLKIARQVQAQAREIDFCKKNRDKVAAAARTLKSNPNDPDACLVYGKHACFLKGDWTNGLPLLAKSSDARLKEIATKELESGADDRAAAVQNADAWYQSLGSINDYPKTQIQMRIYALYSNALPSVTGLTKAKIVKRLDELENVLQGRFDHAALWPALRTAVRDKTYQRIDPMGGAFADKEYSEILDDGVILIGFNYTYRRFGDRDSIDCFQPIYLTPLGEKLGTAHGDMNLGKMMTIKAKPNYAIGKMAIRGGGLWGGSNVIFMRIEGKGLNSSDQYESGWIGHKDQPDAPFLGDGRPIIGIHGRNQRNDAGICSIGFYVVGEKPADPRR